MRAKKMNGRDDVFTQYWRTAMPVSWVAAQLPPMPGASSPPCALQIDLGDEVWHSLLKITKGTPENLAAVMATAARELCSFYAPSDQAIALLVALMDGETSRFVLDVSDAPERHASVAACIQKTRKALLAHLQHAATTADDLMRTATGKPPATTIPFGVAVRTGGEPGPLSPSMIITLDAAAGGHVRIDADAHLYPAPYCRTVLADFACVLGQLVAQTQCPVGQLQVCSDESLDCVRTFSQGDVRPFTSSQRLEHLLEEQARLRPHAVAALQGARRVTYAQLNEMANRVAAALTLRGITPEATVAVSMPRGIGALAAIYGVLKAGAAYVPIDPAYPALRQRYIADDSGAVVVLTGDGESNSAVVNEGIAELRITEELLNAGSAPDPTCTASPDAVAYIIYTSGSTGNPKGVMVEHRSVFNRIEWMQHEYQLCASDVILHKTPISFDVSVWELFWWAQAGAAVSLLPPGGEKHPAEIVATIAQHAVTHLHFVPSMLDAFLTHLGEGHDETALACVRAVFTSGEALTRHQAAAFSRLVSEKYGARLVNLYGPTEATVDVTYFNVEADEGRTSIPIGRPIQNTSIFIVDATGTPVPPGVAGELLIGGVNVARGYHNQPDLTAARFQHIAGAIGQRVYRTGDVARWTSDGLIEYLGRSDHQVKIRGYRIELGEIEEALRTCEGILDVRVLAPARGDGTKVLAAYVVERSPGSMNKDALRAELSRTLPEHMVPAHFVPIDRFPLTPNGKLDRARLPDVFAHIAVDALAGPRNETEAALLDAWKTVLGTDKIGIFDNFFALGGDSISSLVVISKLKAKGLVVSFQDLFQYPMVAQLAEHAQRLGDARNEGYTRLSLLKPADRDRVSAAMEDAYPLSKLQAGLIFQNEIIRGASWYHDIQTFTINAAFDAAAFERALNRMAALHPIFRTSYHLTEYSEFIQMVHREAPVPLTVEDWRDLPAEQQEKRVEDFYREESHRDFDWSRPGLIRIHIHILDAQRFNYNLSFHDSALDGWSINQLHTGLLQRYHQERTGTIQIDHVDDQFLRKYVALEMESLGDPSAQAFWKEELSGMALCELPSLAGIDAQADPFGVEFRNVDISQALSVKIKALAARIAVPVKCVLLAVHLRVLAALCGSAQVVTGYEHSGRPEEPGAERAIGLFLNSLPLRFDMREGESWEALAVRVRDAETRFLPYRRYPMSAMKSMTGIQGPLFQAVFNFTHFHSLKALKRLPGMEDMAFRLKAETEFPLRAEFFQDSYSDDIKLSLHYHVAHFGPVQIARVGGYYLAALEQLADSPESIYLESTLLGTDEAHAIAAWQRGSECALALTSAIHQIAPSCERLGDKVLLRDANGPMTAAMVSARMEGLSRLLQLAHRPQQVIAVALPRSADWICAMAAIMEGGAVYLPIDPAQPDARIRGMLVDAQARVLLCGSTSEGRFLAICAGTDCKTIPLQLPSHASREGPSAPAAAGWNDLAYVLFTSGSTGTPKGAMVEHAGMTNHLLAKVAELSLTERDVMAQTAPATFDVSVWQALIGLSCGAATVVYSADEQLSAASFVEQIERDGITILEVVPSYFSVLLEHLEATRPPLDSLRVMILTGEGLKHQLVNRWFDLYPAIRLLNAYGPTECSDDVAHHMLDRTPSVKNIPIGRPIQNSRLHVLDSADRPVPIGTPGQLCVTGVCVGRGYVNSPEKTALAFDMSHPLGDWSTGRLYRTGDLARWLEDGTLDFLGRRDEQVKIRGMRLELEEIENAMLCVEGMADAAVVCELVSQRLVGFYSGSIESGEAATMLAAVLPAHMVPDKLIRLDRLPTSAAGKVNKRLLLEKAQCAQPEEVLEPAASPAERSVATLWAQALGLEERLIGRNSDFFALGGTSLTAMAAAMRSHGLFSVSDVFAARTLSRLALRLDEDKSDHQACIRRLTKNSADVGVICFSYAGGQAVNFDALARELDKSHALALLAVDYPRVADGAEVLAVEDLARSVLSEMQALPYKRYLVWGHCSGAAAAIALAQAAQGSGERIDALVLGGKLLRSEAAIASQIDELQNWEDAAVIAWLQDASGMNMASALDDVMKNHLAQAFRHDAVAANRFLMGLWRPGLPVLDLPVHCVLAKDDPLTMGSEGLTTNWARIATAVQSHLLEDGGHYFMQTRPAYACAILQRLASTGDLVAREVQCASPAM